MNKLSDFHARYTAIMLSEPPGTNRNVALAQLMTDIEREFHIPSLRNPAWEQANPEVLSLYRIVSQRRTTI